MLNSKGYAEQQTAALFDHLVGESESETVRPSALAALRLMISSIFVVCWTGRSSVSHL
jgi:hypothetical protein